MPLLVAMVVLLTLAGSIVSSSPPVSAQGTAVATFDVTTITEPDFPAGITFSADIPLDGIPFKNGDRVALYYQVSTDETLNLSLVPGSAVTTQDDRLSVSVFVDLQTSFVPPGVALTYYWEVANPDGPFIRSAPESTLWTDTRFDWEIHTSDQVTIYSYGMSGNFAQWMTDDAQATIDDLESRYGIDQIEPLAIWVYPNSQDFAGTMQVNTREAIAGLSYPGSSLIAAVVPDGDKREYGRVIPHEISHQVVFHATENPFAFPPLWLDEGLATHYQTGGTDRYPAMVQRAEAEGTLFDITSLNASFPFQPAQATLAYASSWSIVGYIETTYGPEGIARLLDAFALGLPVDEAVDQALGVSSQQLNDDWHQWISDQNP